MIEPSTSTITFSEEQLDAVLAEVVSAHVDHQLHAGVPVERRLAFRASRLQVHVEQQRVRGGRVRRCQVWCGKQPEINSQQLICLRLSPSREPIFTRSLHNLV